MKRIFGRLWWWTYSMFLPPFFVWAAMEKHEDRRALTTIVALLSLFAWGAMISLFWPLIPTWFWPTYFIFLVVLFFTNNKEKWTSVKKSFQKRFLWIWFFASLFSGTFLSALIAEWKKVPHDTWTRMKLFAWQDPLCVLLVALFLLTLYDFVRLGVVPFGRWLWGGEELVAQESFREAVKRFASFEEAKATVKDGAAVIRHRWGLRRLLQGPSKSVYYSDNGNWPIVRSRRNTVDIRLKVEDASRLICFGGVNKIVSIWSSNKSLEQEVMTLVRGLEIISARLPGMDESGRSKWISMIRKDLLLILQSYQTRLHGASVEGIALYLERENPRPKPLVSNVRRVGLSESEVEQEVARRHEEAEEERRQPIHRDFRRWNHGSPDDKKK